MGRKGVEHLLAIGTDGSDQRVLEVTQETSRRLDAIPGIGPALATALVASVADPRAFRSGRNLSA